MNVLDALGWPEGIAEWPAAPQLRAGRLPELESWFSMRQFDALVDTDSLGPQNVTLIADKQPVIRSSFVVKGRIRSGAIRRHLEGGGTVSLRALEDRLPAVRVACEDLSEQLGHATQANAYLTPSGHQGFAHHWDTHITVAIQLCGQKVWELVSPVTDDPVFPDMAWPTIGFTGDQAARMRDEPPDASYTLRPGDVLWVPRGWIHNPYSPGSSDDPPSLHLTIGIRQRVYLDAATELIARSWRDKAMREAIPPGCTDSVQVEGETRRRLSQYLHDMPAFVRE